MTSKGIDPAVRKIGLLGGCFDPPHNGHLALTALAKSHFGIERFFLVPSGNPPHKRRISPAAQRLEMLRRTIDNSVGLELWDGELHREGPSYTIDTLAHFSSEFPNAKIHFVIGADNLHEIKSWRNWQDILSIVKLCVAARPGSSIEIPKELSSADIEYFPSPMWGLSSSMLRDYIGKGLCCDGLMQTRVVEFVESARLYRP